MISQQKTPILARIGVFCQFYFLTSSFPISFLQMREGELGQTQGV